MESAAVRILALLGLAAVAALDGALKSISFASVFANGWRDRHRDVLY
jgi:hypothetical protein